MLHKLPRCLLQWPLRCCSFFLVLSHCAAPSLRANSTSAHYMARDHFLSHHGRIGNNSQSFFFFVTSPTSDIPNVLVSLSFFLQIRKLQNVALFKAQCVCVCVCVSVCVWRQIYYRAVALWCHGAPALGRGWSQCSWYGETRHCSFQSRCLQVGSEKWMGSSCVVSDAFIYTQKSQDCAHTHSLTPKHSHTTRSLDKMSNTKLVC